MLILYNLILAASLPFAALAFPVLWILDPRFRTGLGERLGIWREDRFLESADPENSPPVFWIHAASVGEIQGAWVFLEAIVRKYPACRLVLTTLTASGHRLLRERLAELEKNPADVLIRLFPVDLPFIALRKMRRIRPSLIILIETELWPNFLRAAERTGIPVMVANGRISPRSYPRYRLIRRFFRRGLRSVRIFLMQSAGDSERITGLGAPAYRVRASGHFKFEQRVRPLPEAERDSLRRAWNWEPGDPVWVAGSTHEGEDEKILEIYQSLKREHPNLRLILAPRHLDRVPALRDLLAKKRLVHQLLTVDDPENLDPIRVVLVDTLGQLGSLYSLADLVFVGGTFVPVGGHNLAEPALCGKPVFFGPEIHQVRETAELLLAARGGILVKDGPSLEAEMRAYLGDPVLRTETGRRAAAAIQGNRGAVDRAVDAAADLLGVEPEAEPTAGDRRSRLHRWIVDSVWTGRGGAWSSSAGGAAGILSGGYRGLLAVREAGFRIGVSRTKRLSRPVISIGNLAVGGTGKTPAVVAACRVLLDSGRRPAIVSRGYGGESRAPVLEVSDGRQVKWPARIVGDEPVLMARMLGGVPVFVGADRLEAGRAVVAAHHPDVVLLDDGFQHRGLGRDLDIVLLDASDPFGNGRLLPAGPLREPVNHLRRAHAFVLTRVESPGQARALSDHLGSIAPGRPCLASRHRWTGFLSLAGGEPAAPVDPEKFRGARVYAVCGIARPGSFLLGLRRAGMRVAGRSVFADHHPFSAVDVETINAQARTVGADAVITTEKDAVRLEAYRPQISRWWAVQMEMTFSEPDSFRELVLRVF